MRKTTDAQMKEIISDYLRNGNEEKFVDRVNERFHEIRGLRRYI